MSVLGQALITEVRRIAADNPYFVYDQDQCTYLSYKEEGVCPSCIIGHALFNLQHIGVQRACYDEPVYEGKAASDVLTRLGLKIDHEESRWLDYVQAGQDGRCDLLPFGHGDQRLKRLCWAGAVAYADYEAKKYEAPKPIADLSPLFEKMGAGSLPGSFSYGLPTYGVSINGS